MTTRLEKLSAYIAPVTSPKSKYYQPSPDFKKLIDLEKAVAEIKARMDGTEEVLFDCDGRIAELEALREMIDRQAAINAKLMAQYEAKVFENLEAK